MTKRPTLVIYLPTLASGGAERLHLHLAPAFVAAGYDVTFLLHRAEGSLLPLLPKGVRVVSLDAKRTLSALSPLTRFIKTEKPDLLLANLGHNNIMAIWATIRARSSIPSLRTRVIASFHNTLSAETTAQSHWQYRILPWLCRRYLKHAHGIVAVSKGVADDLASVTGLPRERITAIYNPIVTPDFDQRMAEPVEHAWLHDGAPPVILGIGRLVAQKDFAMLIKAFATLAREKDAKLIILGEGPLREELLALAQSLGVKDRVDLPGFAANPLPYIRSAAVLAMSSQYEGFGNVLVEALACGTPVVSTDCPYGPAEILDNGIFGKLVPVGDAPAMATALRATLDAPPPRDRLMMRGRAFTVESTAGEYSALFESLLKA